MPDPCVGPGCRTMTKEQVNSFRMRHQSIAANLAQVEIVARSYVEAKPRLRALRQQMLNHLGQQNKDFFSALYEYYADNREATKALEFLEHDVKDMKVRHLLFFEKHSGEMGDVSAVQFPRDLASFAKEVLTRLQMEEEYLIPLLSDLPS